MNVPFKDPEKDPEKEPVEIELIKF